MNATICVDPAEAAVFEGIVRQVMNSLDEGQIDQAVSYFGETFTFSDYGIGLDFHDKEHLLEFFQKERELYPDFRLVVEDVFVTGNFVIGQWSLGKTVTETGFGSMKFKVPVVVKG